MNAIEILGSLLGGTGGAAGSDILSEILGGNKPAPAPRGGSSAPSSSGGSMSSKELEEMLGVGNASPTRPPVAPQAPQRELPRAAPPEASPRSNIPTDIFGQRRQEPKVNLSIPKPAALSKQDEAVLLIRAMINSTKVDGDISEDEQQYILKQVGSTSPETIQFLRTEFARPIDIHEFVASIPLGLEQQIYVISLMAIKLDSKEEADYLRSLSQGLRISPDVCNQLHQRQQVPMIFS